MVLRHSKPKMSSEQPVKKKLRRTDETDNVDEPDFIRNLAENGMATITLNTLNMQLHSANNRQFFRTSDSDHNGMCQMDQREDFQPPSYTPSTENISIQPAPNICINLSPVHSTEPSLVSTVTADSNCDSSMLGHSVTNHDRVLPESVPTAEPNDLLVFQNALFGQCLCGVSENLLRKPFEGQRIRSANGTQTASLSEWPHNKLLQLLSNLQLLFDVYLKQNNNGHICSRVVNICAALIRNEYNLIEQLILLVECRNKYINYLLARVISSFLIIAKNEIKNEWLDIIISYLSLDYVDYDKMNFCLEVFKRIVEWKDVEIHILEEAHTSRDGGTSTVETNEVAAATVNCTTVQFSDSESFDTTAVKGLIIRHLESRWSHLIGHIYGLISTNISVESQTCILTFLSLWESIISVKANLSVVDIKPFYADLENFANQVLRGNLLSAIIWKQLLSLFNEVLCYGSTLALQDMVPDDTCKLAYVIVRSVKESLLFQRLPYRCNEGYRVHGFVGIIPHSLTSQSQIDKTLLQKAVLLVLKSVAVTVKEARTDSSDSSIGSDDTDYFQDMQVIERSIRDVIKKVDVFIKASLDFHPETTFSRLLIHLLSDQDDYMIESMVCTLDITMGIVYANSLFPDLVAMINPIHSFIEFLKVVSHDSDVLLDYLVSNETCFLFYLLRFLKYIKKQWSIFVSSCESSGPNELANTMTVLIRLNMQINRLVAKQLFPYNIAPILKLLGECENMYEGIESS